MRIIGGKFRGRNLLSPKGSTRPTSGQVREALFNILGPAIEELHLLELFAGTGAVGLEALSRGAAHVTFVEQEPTTLKRNIAALELANQTRVIRGDVLKLLPRLPSFDLIFADPPYRQIDLELLLTLCASQLNEGGRLFLEESSRLDIPPIENLQLVKSRTYGRARLTEFIKL